MRKIILRFLLLCLACLFVGIKGSSEETNLLQNPGFEQYNILGRLDSWATSNYIKLNTDTKYVRSGKASLSVTTDTYNYPHVNYTGEMTNLKPGAEYKATAWVYAQNTNTNLHFRYYFWDKDGNNLGDEWAEERYSGAAGAWGQLTDTFRVPKGTVRTTFMLRMGGTGTVYIDDLACTFHAEPDIFYSFTNDGTFYYTERTRPGEMTVNVDTEYHTSLVGEPLLFTVRDGETTLKEESVTIPENGVTLFRFPLSLLSEKGKPYTVSCTYMATGKTVTHTIYKFDRPKRIDENGFFRDENGSIFSPHFICSIGLDDLDMLKAAGFNCVEGYPDKTWLDTIHQKGMKCIVVLYSGAISAGDPARISTTLAYVNTYKEHPAVLGWYIQDEPEPTKEDLEKLSRAYTQIRAVDPEHPVIITALANYDILHQYSDLIIQDSYPYSNSKFTTYPYERNRKAVLETDGRPVYSLLQTFEHVNSFPKKDEVRNMQYAALSAGVKGVGYYRLNGATVNGTKLSNTELWTPISEFGQKQWPEILNYYAYGKYEKTAEYVTDAYHAEVFENGETLDVIVRNKLYDKSVSVSIPIEGLHSGWKLETLMGTPTTLFGRSGEVVVTLKAGDAAGFKVTPGKLSLFERGTNGKFSAIEGLASAENFGVSEEGYLFITEKDGLENPRIYYTFREGYAPTKGNDYALQFLYKSKNGGSPLVQIGKNNPYLNRYAVLTGDAFHCRDKGDGWTEYTAFFTLPVIDMTENITLMLASYGGSGEGWYDGFALYEDASSILITDETGAEIPKLSGGMTVNISIHKILEETESEEEKLILFSLYSVSNATKECVLIDVKPIRAKKSMPIKNTQEEILYYKSTIDAEFSVALPPYNGEYSYKILTFDKNLQITQ